MTREYYALLHTNSIVLTFVYLLLFVLGVAAETTPNSPCAYRNSLAFGIANLYRLWGWREVFCSYQFIIPRVYALIKIIKII